jgi:NAD(P)H dehydrogenase (quinone)
MVSTATQHGGAELALISTQWQMQHHGMIIVPLSYAYQGRWATTSCVAVLLMG